MPFILSCEAIKCIFHCGFSTHEISIFHSYILQFAVTAVFLKALEGKELTYHLHST